VVHDDATGAIVQVRRRVRAGAEQIFDLWTKPDLMVRWMSPFPGAVDCKASCDLRPGGAFSLVMSSEESSREVSGTYVEVVRFRLALLCSLSRLRGRAGVGEPHMPSGELSAFEASGMRGTGTSAVPERRPHPNPPPQAGEGALRRCRNARRSVL